MRATGSILVQKIAVEDAAQLNLLVSALQEGARSPAEPAVVVQDWECATILVLDRHDLSGTVAAIAGHHAARIPFGNDVMLESLTIREICAIQHGRIQAFSVLHIELLACAEGLGKVRTEIPVKPPRFTLLIALQDGEF